MDPKKNPMSRLSILTRILVAGLAAISLSAHAAGKPEPVVIGFDGEYGHKTSTSPQAIERGILIAIDEINAAGGVLGGRPLALKTLDNRSVPARSVENVRALSSDRNLVAVMTGKFSPVVQEIVPVVHELGLPVLDPWAAANDIIDNGRNPNFIFRLSLRDAWAIDTMMDAIKARGLARVALIVPNTGWGRSSRGSAEAYVGRDPSMKLVDIGWYNWGDASLMGQYRAAQKAGAQAIVLVANEKEGAILVREIAALPAAERLPMMSHWGVTGGEFVKLAGPALQEVDFSVVQTYSFIGDASPVAQRVLAAAKKRFGIRDARVVEAPVGMAHAYDLTHLLARAINLAGSTDRRAVRDALEKLGPYQGLVRHYAQPFTAERHEALSPTDVFMARFDKDGAIVRLPRSGTMPAQ
jgi:branched-chain amino acid transport system substrate-binding protein